MSKRVFLIVLDSFGIGELPDAFLYGDAGSNTLRGISTSKEFIVPNLTDLGLFNIDGVNNIFGDEFLNLNPKAAYARMTEKSKGKDTTIGHWEIAGVVSANPLPTYPEGFPTEVISEFEKQTGRKTLCNKPYSGTDVIRDFGDEHVKTGSLIVYTSADSVFQIAAHEGIVPLEDLYEFCRIARKILVGKHGVGRVIARPFAGELGNFKRTPNRHDFSLLPPKKTMLDYLKENLFDVIAIGKITDIFAGSGVTQTVVSKSNSEGIERILEQTKIPFNGLCFLNLVDFDMLYGHRNDIDGYARAISVFDKAIKQICEWLLPEDILLITADHGCDPSFPSTDHTREYTPMLLYGKKISPINLGTRKCFSDIAATILDYFGVDGQTDGESYLGLLLK